MSSNLMILADSIFVLPWYSWVSLAALIAIIVGYKMYQKKMMS